MNEVKRTERGWPGHFCRASDCRFRRNTLLECGNKKIVVSTVGLYSLPGDKKYREIGLNRYYETKAFSADDGLYHDAIVSKEISLDSKTAIGEIKKDSDNEANEMHEKCVEEICKKLLGGTL